jgi:glucose-6-phosphate 1-dehydrogenase
MKSDALVFFGATGDLAHKKIPVGGDVSLSQAEKAAQRVPPGAFFEAACQRTGLASLVKTAEEAVIARGGGYGEPRRPCRRRPAAASSGAA